MQSRFKAAKKSYSNFTTGTGDFQKLFYHCSNGDLEGIKRLIAQGFDFHTLPKDKLAAMWCCLINFRFKECAELLLQHNVDPNVNINGFTPLYVACLENCEEFVSLFLRYKANPNIRTNEGVTPLILTCQKGRDKCAQLLLQHKADLNIVTNSEDSALYLACQDGHDKCVSLLFQHNVDPNIIHKSDGTSPLLLACKDGYHKIVSLLLHFIYC